jgi:hypothetical protein
MRGITWLAEKLSAFKHGPSYIIYIVTQSANSKILPSICCILGLSLSSETRSAYRILGRHVI